MAFTLDRVTYPSAEHWMMAGKAWPFGDADGLAAVLPRGRMVRGFDEQR